MNRYGLQWQVLQDYLAFEETSNSGSWGLGGTGRPPSNMVFLYGKDSSGVSTLCYKNDNNVEICLPTSGSIVTSGGGGVAGRVAFYDATLSLTGDADLTFSGDTLSATKVASSSLTSGRVPFASTAGLLVDNAALTYVNPNLIIDSATADPGLFILGRNAGTSSPHVRLGDDSVANRFQIAMATGNTFFSAIALKNDGIIRTKTDSANMIFLLEGSSLGSFKWSAGGSGADSLRMVFDATNRRLGIGIASPAAPFEIVDDQGSSNNLVRLTRYGGSATNPNIGLAIFAARNTSGSPVALSADDTIFRITGFGYGNAFLAATDVAIRMKAAELMSSSAHGTYITLETTPTGSTTVAERFRVGPAGQWGIGGATYGTAGNFLRSGGASAAPTWAFPDHGAEVGGLGDDDHTQYALLAGRSGGQTLIGGTAAADGLILRATAGVGAGSENVKVQLGSNGAKTIALFQILSSIPSMVLDSGAASTQLSLVFRDNATDKWILYKTTGQLFKLWDSVTGADLMEWQSATSLPAAGATVKIGPTISNANATAIAFLVSAQFTGAGDGPWGASISTTFKPSANIGAAYNSLNIATGDPASGVTITGLFGAYYACNTAGNDGAVTNAYALWVNAPSAGGSMKPTNTYGVLVANQGFAGVTQAIGVYIASQTGATNNFDMLFGASDTSAAGAYYGKVPVWYNGLLKYLHVFS